MGETQITLKTALRSKIENTTALPTLPTVFERITRLLQNPQTSAEEVGRAITVDQSLAAKVLKLVNSAFYGFPGKIGTITHAIVILGFTTVKNIVLTASIFDTFKVKGTVPAEFSLEKFWFHAIATGAAAQSIAKHLAFEEKESCFIAGLIHDIGKIIVCQQLPTEFGATIRNAYAKDILYYDSERELFDITHTEIGSLLAQKWNLPTELQNAIEHHHAPNPSYNHFMITAIVHFADVLVRALDYGNGGDNKIPQIAESAWKNLGIETMQLPQLLESIHEEVEKATIFMQIL